MSPFPQVFQFLVVAVAGWINQQQREVIDYRGLCGQAPALGVGEPETARDRAALGGRDSLPGGASGDGYSVTCTPWSRPIPSSAGIDS